MLLVKLVLGYFQDGDTALIEAAKNNHVKIGELLLHAGAKTDVKNKVSACFLEEICSKCLFLFSELVCFVCWFEQITDRHHCLFQFICWCLHDFLACVFVHYFVARMETRLCCLLQDIVTWMWFNCCSTTLLTLTLKMRSGFC